MADLYKRLPDWQSRLQACLHDHMQMDFEWGKHDCCLFVCDCVLAMTGHDPAVDLRSHRNEREAMRIVINADGVAALARERLGDEISPLMARVGDIGLVTVDERDSLALCNGATWLATGAHGLVTLKSAKLAWRCECHR